MVRVNIIMDIEDFGTMTRCIRSSFFVAFFFLCGGGVRTRATRDYHHGFTPRHHSQMTNFLFVFTVFPQERERSTRISPSPINAKRNLTYFTQGVKCVHVVW
jgi:hypothetical protein